MMHTIERGWECCMNSRGSWAAHAAGQAAYIALWQGVCEGGGIVHTAKGEAGLHT